MGSGLEGIPRLHPEAGVQKVGKRILAISPGDWLHTFEDESGNVSEVGERIIELIDGSRAVDQIVDVLCEEFEVEREQCKSDAQAFILLLAERQVVIFE